MALVLAAPAQAVPVDLSAPGADRTITIDGFTYDPPDILIAVGQSVSLPDEPIHPLIGEGPLPTDPDAPGGSFTFNQAGTYRYYCNLHNAPGEGGMEGVVRVGQQQPPVAAVAVVTQPPKAAAPVMFSAAGTTDPDEVTDAGGFPHSDDPREYTWDLDGNGTFETPSGSVAATSTTYGQPGQRTVRVRVTDVTGLSDDAEVTFTVAEADPVSTATATATATSTATATATATSTATATATATATTTATATATASPSPTATATPAPPGTPLPILEPAPPPDTAARAPVVGRHRRTGARLRIPLRCPAVESRCRGRLTARLGRRSLGARTFNLAGGRSATLVYRLPARARGRVSLNGTSTDAAGNRTTFRATVRLR